MDTELKKTVCLLSDVKLSKYLLEGKKQKYDRCVTVKLLRFLVPPFCQNSAEEHG